MADKNLERLNALTVQFGTAVEGTFGQDRQVQQTMWNSLTSDEMKEFMGKVQLVASHSFKNVLSGESDDDFLKKNIEIVDMGTAFMLRALPIKTLAGVLPEALKNQADAQAFKTLGAPTLAKLCEFKV